MDGGVAAAATAAAVGAWDSIRGFFTPATLFLVVNLVIGTIALTSRSHNQRRRRGGYNSHDDADARDHLVQEQENQYYDQQHQEQQYVPPPPAPLARTSSVMDRLRSMGLNRFRSGDFPPEYAAPAAAAGTYSRDAAAPAAHGDAHYARSRSEPAPVPEKRRATGPSTMKKSSSEVRKAEVAPAPAPAWVIRAAVLDEEEDVVDARAEEFAESFATQPPAQQQEEEEEVYYPEEYVPPLRPAPLARTSSVLDRLRSFSLYRLRSGDLGPEAATAASTHDAATAAAAADEKKAAQAAHYARSRSEPAREQSKKDKKQQLAAAEAKMTKSSSEARKPAAAAQEEPEAESVDARADNFINSFRQQLQLQRLNSLLNYKQSGAK